MSVEVYGASDDLIEVEGDIREEFSAIADATGMVLAFSDGTLLRIDYDRDGVWRIAPLVTGPSTQLRVVQAPADDESNYSDHAFLDGTELGWVLLGSDYATRKKASAS